MPRIDALIEIMQAPELMRRRARLAIEAALRARQPHQPAGAAKRAARR